MSLARDHYIKYSGLTTEQIITNTIYNAELFNPQEIMNKLKELDYFNIKFDGSKITAQKYIYKFIN